MISHYPKIMLLPVKRVNMVSLLLREKCLFTSHQVTDILRDSPEVLEEDLAQLEYKFQVGLVFFTKSFPGSDDSTKFRGKLSVLF